MPPDPAPPPPDPPPPPPPYWAVAVPTTPCSSKMQSTDSTLFDIETPSLRRGQLSPARSYLSVGSDPDEDYAGSRTAPRGARGRRWSCGGSPAPRRRGGDPGRHDGGRGCGLTA